MKILAIIGLAVVLLAAVAILAVQQRRAAERRSEMAHLHVEYRSLLAVHDAINGEYGRWRTAADDYAKYETTAESASQARHDKVVAGEHDDAAILELIDGERDAERSMSAAADREFDAMDAIANKYAGTYGDDAVRSLRDHISAARSARTMEFNDWDRGISDIQDDVRERINGIYHAPSANIESLYHESDNQGAEADRRVEIVKLDIERLGKRYESDTENLKKAEGRLR